MERLFVEILKRIAEKMPQLSLVDEDYGQLETQDDTYPVTFPCVLVGNADVNWNDIGMGKQMGTATLTARLAIDCYDDTHLGSGTEERTACRLRMANELYTALQGFCPVGNMGSMYRVKTRFYSLPGAIKVYEHIFEFEVNDDSAVPE